MKNITIPFVIVMLSLFSAVALGDDGSKQKFSYPELLVVPKASERLQKEARLENSKAWTSHIPIQVSALVTLGSGMMAMNDSDKDKDKKDTAKGAGQFAVLVGGSWLSATVLTSALYRPYRSCYKTVKPSKPKNSTEQLAKERAAEECIDSPATLSKKANWLSFLTNAAASAYVASAANDDLTKAAGGAAILAAFAPIMFNYHWQDVKEYHNDYKKRIYGPIVQSGFSYHGKLAPTLTASIRF